METDATGTNANSARKSAPDNTCLVYVPREDASPEGELATLAAVYRFVLQHHEKKNDAGVSEGEEAAGQGPTEGHAPEKGKL